MKKYALSFLHLLLFALTPLVSLYGLNRGEVSLGEFLGTLGSLCLCLPVLLVGFLVLSGRRPAQGERSERGERAALALSLLLFSFFSFSLVAPLIDELYEFVFALTLPQLLLLPRHQTLAALWLLPLGVGLGLILRGRYETKKAVALASVLGVGNFIPALFLLLTPPRLSTLPAVASPAPSLSAPQAVVAPKPSETPDLYCIVLDAYARQDQLQHLYQYDNSPFLKQLEARGFRVLAKSRANYLQTVLAVAATLNLDYLPADKQLSRGVEQAASWIKDNRLQKILKQRGYTIVDIPSDFSPTALSGADIRLTEIEAPQAVGLTPFARLVLAKTPLAFLLYDDRPAYDQHRAQILGTLSNLSKAAKLEGPKFVFAHVLAPHPPFVLNKDAQPTYPRKAQFTLGDATDFGMDNQNEYRVGYREQLQGLNKKVIEALDGLLASSTRPAVIVVMGDHGARMQTDWKSLKKTNIDEAFANLQAVRIPESVLKREQQGFLKDSLTPLNTFRLLLKHVYGENLEPLPDRSFYSTLQNPLDFVEVTTQLP